MFLGFLAQLRQAGVPVSLREFLTFLEAMGQGLVTYDNEGFHHLARTIMVKDERHLDRFDQAFAASFGGIDRLGADAILEALDLPPDWLERQAEKHLTNAEMAELAAIGGFDRLMQTLRARLREQQGRHQGGSKWIGTAGTSPFGAFGYNPEGVRIGQPDSRHRRAAKVWDRREFRDFDDAAALGTRAIKVALRRLRQWARDGATHELDLDGTIRATATQGWIDVRTRPERRNAVKVLLFLDVGGSMDDHVKIVEELFTAARGAFRHLEPFYFHNCPYDALWRDNRRRHDARLPTWDILHRYGPDWKCIFVGDASMSPYEIAFPGGANEYWNAETGQAWLERFCRQWPAHLWINPLAEHAWAGTQSVGMIRDIVGAERMVPMTLDGIAAGMRQLGNRRA